MIYHLAQLNIGRALAPLDSPQLHGFMSNLDKINALAEQSDGFVWRLQDDNNNATSFRPFDDPEMLVNMSVWTSIETLKAYTYKSDHVTYFKQRGQWFEKMTTPHMVLWWIEAGHTPTLEEAKEKLSQLTQHGPTAAAFTFAKPFPPPKAQLNEQAHLKQLSAETAADRVQSNMVVGLGTGSTASYAVRHLGARLQRGEIKNIIGIPTSSWTAELAQSLGIPLTTLAEHPVIDLTIDGADEVDPRLNMIKGGGGALLREKIVAQATRHYICIVDETKQSDYLGTTWALPIEVVPFGWASQAAFIQSLGADVVHRHHDDGTPYLTDQGNYILDSNFGPIIDPIALSAQLNARSGIAEHGLFIGVADELVVAGTDGVRFVSRSA